MWSVDQYKGFFDWRGDGPDEEPRYGVFYLIVIPIAASVLYVKWFGWTWPALALTILTTAVVVGLMVVLSAKRYRREQSQIPEWR